MLYDIHPIARKLNEVLKGGQITAAEIARACGVSDQAVNGWRKTGRVDKAT